MDNYQDHIQFEGATWKALKHHLEVTREKKVGMLIGAKDHDTSNLIRGAIAVLDQLLALDKPTANTVR